MKSISKGVVPALALILAGQLYAQPTQPAPDETPAPATAPAGSQLSAAEMTARATEHEAQIRVDTQHVQHLQAVARREKDVIKLSCVNDKFVKLKAEANLFDNANLELKASLGKDDRFTIFVSASGAADRVHKLREEADGCAGEPELGSGESRNDFDAPDIIDDPTTGLPFDGYGTLVEPPGYASPYS